MEKQHADGPDKRQQSKSKSNRNWTSNEINNKQHNCDKLWCNFKQLFIWQCMDGTVQIWKHVVETLREVKYKCSMFFYRILTEHSKICPKVSLLFGKFLCVRVCHCAYYHHVSQNDVSVSSVSARKYHRKLNCRKFCVSPEIHICIYIGVYSMHAKSNSQNNIVQTHAGKKKNSKQLLILILARTIPTFPSEWDMWRKAGSGGGGRPCTRVYFYSQNKQNI